jgi:hypothetical protein
MGVNTPTALAASRAPQTINFAPLASKTLLQSPVIISAIASSGLAASFATSTPWVCSSGGADGATLTLRAAGTCSVVADQAGDAKYLPAPPVYRSFVVTKATQTIKFAPLANKTLPQSPVTVSAIASSGLPVSFLTTTPGVCTPGGANGATIHLVKVGTCTVAGYQLGNWEYLPAAPVSQSFRTLALPTLTTTPSSTSVTLGTLSVTLKDTAVLSGGYSPTGTITFTLYYSGAITPVDTEEATVSGNGSYTTPAGYSLPTTGTVTGTYQWDATYSGDSNNSSVSEDNALSEQVGVSGASPDLSTTPSTTSVTLGGSSVTLDDTATLSGGYSPTGTITFTLFYNSATTPVDTETVSVNANGSYTTPAGYTLPTTGTVAGTYQWDASYSGDTDNASVSDNGAAGEQVTVTAEWQTGDLATYNQVEWVDGGTPGLLSSSTFNSVYASGFGELVVGSASGFEMDFDSGAALYDYLPAHGAVGALDADLLDPTGLTASGAFGGDVVTLALNVDYSDAGLLQGSSGLNFGDLFVCGLSTDTDLNGLTVSDVLGIENTALGGGTTSDTIADLDAIASDLSGAFDDGTPSTFALDHLAESSSCTAVNWADGAVVTYGETEWQQQYLGLLLDFNSVYGSDVGELTVGSTYTMAFDSAAALLAYLPQTNPTIGPLDASLLDPTTSASGQFGGDVVALELNVDFSAAGYIQGSSGLQFGDLTVCGLSTDTDLNGMTVSEVLGIENMALGGGMTTDGIADLDSVASDLNASFEDGIPSDWAQAHLVDGSCT